MGVVSGVSTDDDWIFTPNADVTVDVADANYLHYGFWLQKTADKDGKVTYNEVETFAGVTGADLAASGDTGNVEGTATYTGGAAGVYVHHVYTPGGGSRASSTSGRFSATASLTANFGGDDVAVSAADRLPPTTLATRQPTAARRPATRRRPENLSVPPHRLSTADRSPSRAARRRGP